MANATTTHEMAKVFVERYGSKAALEVRKRERQAIAARRDGEADDWKRVRDALEIMKGPPVT